MNEVQLKIVKIIIAHKGKPSMELQTGSAEDWQTASVY